MLRLSERDPKGSHSTNDFFKGLSCYNMRNSIEVNMHRLLKTFRRRLLPFFAFALVSVAVGCSVHEPRPVIQKELTATRPTTILEKEKTAKRPGPPPFSEKVEPVTKGLQKEIRLYSLVFDRVPLGEALSTITSDTDLNLSVESGVDLARAVTVRLTNVTLEEALDMIVVNGAGYAWAMEEGILHIKKFEERIYHLDYLNLAGETEIDVGGDMLGSSVEDPAVAGRYQVKVTRESNQTDVWDAVLKTLEGLKSEDGNLRINRNAGIIYMADTPSKIRSMVRFLDSLSESLHRQVLIEAKILEVNLTDTHKFGIDWSNLEIAFKSDWGALPDNLEISLNAGGAIVLADRSRFSAIIDFLRTQGDVTALSNPHLAVMNGQSAVITVGFQFPFGDISGVDQGLETDVITFRTSIRRAVLGLQLGITPQISRDGIVTLHIVPTITRIQREEQVELPVTTTSTVSISNPVIDLQEVATMVRVKEGNLVVLGGLISQLRSLNHEGLPWLNKLPILKYLFGRMAESEENRELVIFITPHVKKIS